MITFGRQYQRLLTDLLSPNSAFEHNTRTGHGVYVWPGMRMIELDLSDEILPTCGVRRTHPHVAAAENAWCLLGHSHITWLKQHTSVWNEFADENDVLKEAYGYRWRDAFNRDQIEDAIKALKANPSNRRVWISSWHPEEDIPQGGQKTIPCPVGFTLQIVAGRLNSAYFLRSSDTFLGLPHDIMRHALLMNAIARSLDRRLGIMSFAIANSHLYDIHRELAETAIYSKSLVEPDFTMPYQSVDNIVYAPDDYVYYVKEKANKMNWPEWNPKVPLIK